MTYDVVTCGITSAPLPWLGQHQRPVLPDPAAPDFLDVAFTALHDLDPDERVLLVHAAGRAASHQLSVLRAALRNPSVVPLGLPMPSTGVAATASWLAALAHREVSAGVAMANLRMVAAHLPTYAVATSVAGVELPQVRLRHHVLSWVPGTVFSISMTDRTTVEVGAASAVEPVATDTATVVWAGDQRLAGKLGASLPPEIERVELEQAGETQMWRRARFYEHTVVPHDVDAFAERLRSMPLGRCPQCGDAMNHFCSFCLTQEGAPA